MGFSINRNIIKTITDKLDAHDKELKASVINLQLKRTLTTGEIAMSRLIFKNAIDYSKVLIHMGGAFHSKYNVAMTPAGELILPIEDFKKTPDFSIAPAGDDRHWFMHEMVHVWQHQNGANVGWLGAKLFCKGGYTSKVNSTDSGADTLKAYDTDIGGRDVHKKFQEYNMEQQAAIIAMWFDAVHLHNIEPQRPHHQRSLRLQGHLNKILVDFLKNPNDKSLIPES